MAKVLRKGKEYRLIRSGPHEGNYPDTPIHGTYLGMKELIYNHNFYGRPMKAMLSTFKTSRGTITGVTHHVEEGGL